MQTIIQRVTQAQVTVDGEVVGKIGEGLVALVAVAPDDDGQDVEWTFNKLLGLRIFRNGDKHFDYDVRKIDGGILLVSNFTVAADARKGRRPSFEGAAPAEVAEKLFAQLVQITTRFWENTQSGRFGADNLVSLTNDGPATFILDSRLTLRR
jgi:D-aminoacyl-tRNA deacylase